MKSKKFCALVLLVLTAALASTAFAQSDRGGITGTVKDPNGAVVANAKVTVTNAETSEAREAITTDEGNFTVPQLQAATYQCDGGGPGLQNRDD